MRTIFLTGAFLLLSSAAFAGEYDGVYQYGLSPTYYSVHQNGSQLLVISLATIPSSGGIEYTVGQYKVQPTTVGDWSYALGKITGNTARITGINIFGTCATVTDVSLEKGLATATFVSSTNTAFGTAQGVNCSQLYQDATASIGSTITLRRIF